MQEVRPTVLQLVREALENKDRPWLEDQLAQYRLPRLRPFNARIARDIIANKKVMLFQFRREDLIRIPYCTTMDEGESEEWPPPEEEEEMKSEPPPTAYPYLLRLVAPLDLSPSQSVRDETYRAWHRTAYLALQRLALQYHVSTIKGDIFVETDSPELLQFLEDTGFLVERLK
jgi:hypothetical protein